MCEQCWQKKNEEFRCLESTFRDADAQDRMIISEGGVTADTDDEQIVCWLLATYGYSQNAIYRLTAEQCNSDDRDRNGAVQRTAVATLVEVRHGAGGWFDAITVTDDGREHGRTTSKAPTADDDDDFSFLDGTTYVYVYDEPYIATDLEDDERGGQSDAVLYSSNSAQSHNSDVIIYPTVAALARISVLLAL